MPGYTLEDNVLNLLPWWEKNNKTMTKTFRCSVFSFFEVLIQLAEMLNANEAQILWKRETNKNTRKQQIDEVEREKECNGGKTRFNFDVSLFLCRFPFSCCCSINWIDISLFRKCDKESFETYTYKRIIIHTYIYFKNVVVHFLIAMTLVDKFNMVYSLG